MEGLCSGLRLGLMLSPMLSCFLPFSQMPGYTWLCARHHSAPTPWGTSCNWCHSFCLRSCRIHWRSRRTCKNGTSLTPWFKSFLPTLSCFKRWEFWICQKTKSPIFRLKLVCSPAGASVLLSGRQAAGGQAAWSFFSLVAQDTAEQGCFLGSQSC